MSIRSKLMTTAFTMVLAVGAIGWLFLWTRDIEHHHRKKMVSAVEALTQLRELSADIERQIARVDFYLIGRDVREIDIFESLSKSNSRRLKQLTHLPWIQDYRTFLEASAQLFAFQAGRTVSSDLRLMYAAKAGELRKKIAGYLGDQEKVVEKQRIQTDQFLEKMEWISILIVAVGVLLAVMMNAFIYRSIVYPLDALKHGVEALGRGEQKPKVLVKGRDEFFTLAKAFNDMVLRLAELDQMKQDFTASVTHELRSPLSAGQSFLNVLLEDMDKAAADPSKLGAADFDRWKTFLTRLRANLDRLNRFVSDLLDVAKIERGKLECRLESVSIAPLLQETTEFFMERAKQKGVQLELVAPSEMPLCRVDLDRIRQVMVNLVDNAIKFTPREGKVSIKAGFSDHKFFKVSIQDSGPGIPREHRDRLFGKFVQIKESYRYAEGARGTGLGLAICKAIVDLHGGKIWADPSPNGSGTVFSFTLLIV